MGSRTIVHAAVGTDGDAFKGEYLSDCKVDLYGSWGRGLMVGQVSL
jgi:hypothetical protein